MGTELKRLYRYMLNEKVEIDEIEERNNVYFIHLFIPWSMNGSSLKSRTMVMLKPKGYSLRW